MRRIFDESRPSLNKLYGLVRKGSMHWQET
jgi:hypothetical protein